MWVSSRVSEGNGLEVRLQGECRKSGRDLTTRRPATARAQYGSGAAITHETLSRSSLAALVALENISGQSPVAISSRLPTQVNKLRM